MVHLDESTHLYEKILDIAPQAVDKIQQMFAKKDSSSESNSSEGHTHQQKENIEF